ncbi:MAG: cysteine--tRNA ligase [Rikenellaceae bacterium]
MELQIYNTLSRKKELFTPLRAPHVGMYVCGPTVYGDPHLGHARPSITFDILFRLLKALDFKVRYVRNITDVGHLENDADEGEDKIAKKARLENIEPMEVANYYTNRYRDAMKMLGVLPPSIEPLASGHIIEQIEMVKDILDKGFAYESNGSIYFDVEKYDKEFGYGKLSGRVLEDMNSATRALDGQSDKHAPFDFALWKKASPAHIMRWGSPWSDGFPGWHMECSAMSTKYLGEQFDIHGGGMDLMFPHHECEIAQSRVACGVESARYWVHNNMITINGQKMGKSLGNFITLEELFNGTHAILVQPYSPMTIRFFILQASYRSTLDFSNEALQAAGKGYERIMKAYSTLSKIEGSDSSSLDFSTLKSKVMEAVCDDLNTPIAIAELFEVVKMINQVYDKKATISKADLEQLKEDMRFILSDLLGLEIEEGGSESKDVLGGVIDMILEVRQEAKAAKDWATSDKIRDRLLEVGVVVKDRKDGFDWELK